MHAHANHQVKPGTDLNIRREPNARSPILGKFHGGDRLVVEGFSPDRHWVATHCGATSGWCNNDFIQAYQDPGEFPWLSIAWAELGVSEVVGKEANPRIVEYLRSTKVDPALAAKDETSWCSAFVNWCVEQAGYDGTKSAWARDWLRWGKELDVPIPGCVVVFSRNVTEGHVGFFVGWKGGALQLLGGNQGGPVHQVCLSSRTLDNLLGYRGLVI